jgi:hypothetical protein
VWITGIVPYALSPLRNRIGMLQSFGEIGDRKARRNDFLYEGISMSNDAGSHTKLTFRPKVSQRAHSAALRWRALS